MPPEDLNIIINMAPSVIDDAVVADVVVNNHHHHIVSMVTNNDDVFTDTNHRSTNTEEVLSTKKKVSYDNYGSSITPENKHWEKNNINMSDNDNDTIKRSLNDNNDDNIFDNNNKKYKSTRRPSNEYVLNVAFYTFLLFCIFQYIFAVYIAHSQSMKADSEAMSIDALTYLFNLIAERLKYSKLTPYELTLSSTVCQYKRKLRRLYLELIPPAISVITLLIITMFTLREAIQTLHGVVNDNDNNNGDDVSIGLMLIFSSANLLLDFVNVTCFARSHSLFGIQMIRSESQLISDSIRSISHSSDTTTTTTKSSLDEINNNNNNCNSCACHHNRQQQQNFTNKTNNGSEQQNETLSLLPITTSTIMDDDDDDDDTNTPSTLRNIFSNLNMCSAWTVCIYYII